jgi:tetratricopeptide (TPR) repeat protein
MERARLIDALSKVWQTSVESDFVDMGDEGIEALARWASVDEQQRVRDRLREYMVSPAGPDEHQTFRVKETLRVLSQLAGEAGLSPEELLDEYRRAGLWQEAIQSLLELDRVDEAVALAPRHLDARQLLTLADQLVARADPQRLAQALNLIDDCCWEREGKNAQDDQLLLAWLERHYAEHGQPEKSFETAQRRFKHAPSSATFAAVRTAANLPGLPADTWSKLRPTLLSAFVKRGNPLELIDVHLAEEEIGEAIKALDKARKSDSKRKNSWNTSWNLIPEHVELRIASAAEKTFPDEAIRLYQEVAERRISFRERANYQAAATYLVRVMNLLERNGRAEDWQAYITNLRAQNKSLKALREELDCLGLA